LGEITERIKLSLGKTLKKNPKIPSTLEVLLYMAYILVYDILKRKTR
jgi:hypothetical protein